MSVEQNKAIARRITEAFNKKNLSILPELFSPEFVWHRPEGDLTFKDFQTSNKELLNAFPDLKIILDDLIAEGDKFVGRWTLSATHKGEFMGIPGTGKKIKINAMTIRRVAGGKCIEGWDLLDNLNMMQQLGVMPKPK